MTAQLIVRPGTLEDYPSFAQAEEVAWAGTEVPIITIQQYQNWLTIFPQGLLLAERQEKICGHLFAQICEFDPLNTADNRDWDTVTDKGYARQTHNPKGNTLYVVSFSASSGGAGKKLARAGMALAANLGREHYAGACRMPGLAAYAQNLGLSIDAVAEDYANAVVASNERGTKQRPKVLDPTLSVVLSTRGIRFYRLLPNYFHDQQSGNWAALIGWNAKA